MPITLIATDLDDTLLREDLTISPRNRAALIAARERGIHVVLASGRNIHSMGRYARELGIDGPGHYLISTNGAEILETATGRTIYEMDLDGDLCREAARAATELGFHYQFYEDGAIRPSAPNPWSDFDHELTGQPLKYLGEEEKDEALGRGHSKFLILGPGERIAEAMPGLVERFQGRAEVYTSKPFFLEIMPQGAGKGVALGELCRHLGLDLADCLAIGDSLNDLGMLRAAGQSWAPANAHPEAKAAAKAVSAFTHEDDAVGRIVEAALGL